MSKQTTSKIDGPPRYRLTVRPLPDETDPDGIRRLRHVLKSLLRAYRIRCERFEPAQAPRDKTTV